MLSTEFLHRLLANLRRSEPRMTHLLRRFVRAESPSLDKAAVDRFGRIVAQEWRQRGARVEILPRRGRGNLIRATLTGRSRRPAGQILVLGHLDTVYDIGAIARMPFRVAAGNAYGPGVLDMKSGLVLALFAVDGLRDLGVSSPKRVVFLWTPDEEIGSEASRGEIEREARRSDAVLVLEPGTGPAGGLKTARKGLGHVEVEVTGRAAHAGINPEEGVNAVHELALQIARIMRFNDLRRGVTLNVNFIEGGKRTNVVAERARAVVDIRAARISDMRVLEKRLRKLRPILPGARVKVHGGFNRPPLERRMSVALFRKARALGKGMGLHLEESFTGGGSDGNLTAALGVPTLDGLGGAGAGAHSPGEYALVRRLPERAALLAALLATL